MENLALKISLTLKGLRKQKGWSLELTSQKTGVSKAMLGQIERGESVPTITTLWKIASGFDVSFSSFVEDVAPNKRDLLFRRSKLQHLDHQADKINFMPIFPYDSDLKFEVFIIELHPSCTHISTPHQKGVIEHVIPINGLIEILVHKKWRKVSQNEGLRFKADRLHGYRNLSDQPKLFHDIIHYMN